MNDILKSRKTVQIITLLFILKFQILSQLLIIFKNKLLTKIVQYKFFIL
jgi:hypothetical protein